MQITRLEEAIKPALQVGLELRQEQAGMEQDWSDLKAALPRNGVTMRLPMSPHAPCKAPWMLLQTFCSMPVCSARSSCPICCKAGRGT